LSFPFETVSHVLISVVIPVRNRTDLLRRAVGSVLRQTHRPLEVVVVDDCSSEDIAAAVADMAADSLPIRVLRNAENAGGQASRLAGVRAASGNVVALLDSDDWWEPTKLQLQLDALLQPRQPGVVPAAARHQRQGDAAGGHRTRRAGARVRVQPRRLPADQHVHGVTTAAAGRPGGLANGLP